VGLNILARLIIIGDNKVVDETHRATIPLEAFTKSKSRACDIRNEDVDATTLEEEVQGLSISVSSLELVVDGVSSENPLTRPLKALTKLKAAPRGIFADESDLDEDVDATTLGELQAAPRGIFADESDLDEDVDATTLGEEIQGLSISVSSPELVVDGVSSENPLTRPLKAFTKLKAAPRGTFADESDSDSDVDAGLEKGI